MHKKLHLRVFSGIGFVVLVFFSAFVLSVPMGGFSANATEKEQYETYVLKAGEGFSTVAEKYDVPLQRIIELNRDRLPDRNNPDKVFRGMKVRVPVKQPKAVTQQPAPAVKQPAPAATPNSSASANRFTLPSQSGAVPEGVTPPTLPADAPVATPEKEPEPKTDAPTPTTQTPKESPEVPEKEVARDKHEETRQIADKDNGGMAAWYGSLTPSDPMFWLLTIIVALLAIIVLSVIVLLFRTYSGRTVIDVRDTGKLRLVAARELGKNARLFWFKAGEQDVFVSTGSDAQIVTADIAGVKEEMEKPEKPAPAPRSSPTTRRTRKSQPAAAASEKATGNGESAEAEAVGKPADGQPTEQTGN